MAIDSNRTLCDTARQDSWTKPRPTCRDCNASAIAQRLARLQGELVQVHVLGGRSFVGIFKSVDACAGLVELEQLGDGEPVWVVVSTLVAIGPAQDATTWSLIAPESTA
jgi:hypothetical protein